MAKKSRYTLYDIILFTQSSNVGMKVLIDNEAPDQKSRKPIEEQYDACLKGDQKTPIHFHEATGGFGRINANAIAFLGHAPCSEETATKILAPAPEEKKA